QVLAGGRGRRRREALGGGVGHHRKHGTRVDVFSGHELVRALSLGVRRPRHGGRIAARFGSWSSRSVVARGWKDGITCKVWIVDEAGKGRPGPWGRDRRAGP